MFDWRCPTFFEQWFTLLSKIFLLFTQHEMCRLLLISAETDWQMEYVLKCFRDSDVLRWVWYACNVRCFRDELDQQLLLISLGLRVIFTFFSVSFFSVHSLKCFLHIWGGLESHWICSEVTDFNHTSFTPNMPWNESLSNNIISSSVSSGLVLFAHWLKLHESSHSSNKQFLGEHFQLRERLVMFFFL